MKQKRQSSPFLNGHYGSCYCYFDYNFENSHGPSWPEVDPDTVFYNCIYMSEFWMGEELPEEDVDVNNNNDPEEEEDED